MAGGWLVDGVQTTGETGARVGEMESSTLDIMFPADILDQLRSLYFAGANRGDEAESRGFVRALVAVGLSCHVQRVLGRNAPRRPPEELVLALLSGQLEPEP